LTTPKRSPRSTGSSEKNTSDGPPLPRGWLSGSLEEKQVRKAAIRRLNLRLFYRRDLAAFAHDCLDWPEGKGPSSYQDEAWAELYERRKYALWGPHGLGKTTIESVATLGFALATDGDDDWKNPTTAGVGRQLFRYLWPEIHKWARLLRYEKMGWHRFDERSELLTYALQLRTGSAFAVTASDAAGIEGAHADRLLYGYDESKLISAATFNASEGAFAGAGVGKQEAYALAAGTPGDPAGRFFEICSRAPGYRDWTVRHVTAEECVAAGRMSSTWIEARKAQWGENSPIFQQRCLGLFAAAGGDGVIPLAWIELAVERWKALTDTGDPLLLPRHLDADHRWRLWLDSGGNPGPLTHLGVDVADGGADDTVLSPRYGRLFAPLRYFPSGDPAATASRAAAVLEGAEHWASARRRPLVVVDAIGVGSGTAANLKRDGYRVEGFVASESAGNLKDASGEFRFSNLRAAAWWALREGLDPATSDLALPPDDRMISELAAPRWKPVADGKILVEPKDGTSPEWGIRQRIGSSTDAADGVVMGHFGDVIRSVARSNMGKLRGVEL